MVRAILEGRKTMTRRVVKGAINEVHIHGNPVKLLADWPLSGLRSFADGVAEFAVQCAVDDADYETTKCPYGVPGDRLWVRETFLDDGETKDRPQYVYRADNENYPRHEGQNWKPSIFMPRAASRILLEVTDIRMERLQEVSEEDAAKEGAEPVEWSEDFGGMPADFTSYKEGFKEIWQSINGPDSWDQNPWVWVVEFRKIEQE